MVNIESIVRHGIKKALRKGWERFEDYFQKFEEQRSSKLHYLEIRRKKIPVKPALALWTPETETRSLDNPKYLHALFLELENYENKGDYLERKGTS